MMTDEPMRGAAKPKPKIVKLFAIGLLCLSALCAVLLVLAGMFTAGEFHFSLHRARYAAVIDRVKTFDLAPGQSLRLKLDDLTDPTTLRIDTTSSTPQRGDGKGTVWVEVSADKRLTIAIETLDMGHAGEFGYLYSETDQTPGRSIEGPGREWTVDDPLGDGWWLLSYRLG